MPRILNPVLPAVALPALALPALALIARYAGGPHYTDCFVVDTVGLVPLPAFVCAFYTTPVFRVERAVLALAGYPSTDGQAQLLAQGQTDRFAAWQVEARAADQILLADVTGRTRSWLMVAQGKHGGPGTRLLFGSVVMARSAAGAEDRAGRVPAPARAGDGEGAAASTAGHGDTGAAARPQNPRRTLGPVFTALLGPHRHYSRMLLTAAARRLARQTPWHGPETGRD